MPLINGCKYSCEPCIRGHRATSCAHTDRILIEVRKPGRPLESCGHGLNTCDCGRVEELLSVPMNDSFSSPLDLLPTAGPESCIAVKTPHSVTTGLSNAKSPGFDRVQSRVSKKTKKKSTSPFPTLEVAMGSHKPSSNLNEYFENFTQPLNAVCNTKPCSQGIQDQHPFLQAATDDLSFSKAFPETGSGPYTPPAEYVPYQTSYRHESSTSNSRETGYAVAIQPTYLSGIEDVAICPWPQGEGDEMGTRSISSRYIPAAQDITRKKGR